MAVSKTITLGSDKFTARRLNNGELREMLLAIEGRRAGERVDLVDFLVEDGLPHEAFYLSLGLDGEEDLDGLTPEDVVALMDLVAAVNPSYAGAEKRRVERVQKVREQLLQLQGLRSSAPTSSSSASAISGTTISTTQKPSSDD